MIKKHVITKERSDCGNLPTPTQSSTPPEIFRLRSAALKMTECTVIQGETKKSMSLRRSEATVAISQCQRNPQTNQDLSTALRCAQDDRWFCHSESLNLILSLGLSVVLNNVVAGLCALKYQF